MSKYPSNNILLKINHKENIVEKDINIESIVADGNCFYRCISLYYTGIENNY